MGASAHREDELDLLARTPGQLLEAARCVEPQVREHAQSTLAVKVREEVLVVVEQLRCAHVLGQKVAVGQVGHLGLGLYARSHALYEDLSRRRLDKAVCKLDECRLA